MPTAVVKPICRKYGRIRTVPVASLGLRLTSSFGDAGKASRFGTLSYASSQNSSITRRAHHPLAPNRSPTSLVPVPTTQVVNRSGHSWEDRDKSARTPLGLPTCAAAHLRARGQLRSVTRDVRTHVGMACQTGPAMSAATVLDREMFAEAEAARLLRLPQSTLHYWLEGGDQRGKTHKPILRIEPTGSRSVTWAEFVEAGLLRCYRNHRVPMNELRTFIERLRSAYGVPYPLAHHQPFVSGRQLVYKAQLDSNLDSDFFLVSVSNNQLVLTTPSQEFVERVRWADDIAVGWRPHDDPHSPVVMTPDVRFGRPAVSGISTDVIWEHEQAGEDPNEIAEAFDLDLDDVHWALSYEYSVRAKAA